MKPLNILVVEDNETDAFLLTMLLDKLGYAQSGIATSLEEADHILHTAKPDISIIDIYLHGKADGIAFAEKISASPEKRHPFIFLTSATDKETFNKAKLTQPFSYLLKPFNEPSLQYAIELAVEKFSGEDDGYFAAGGNATTLLMQDTFFVKRGHSLIKVTPADIRYIEVDGKYCKLVCEKDRYIIQKSMKQLLDQLPGNTFARVHRNYLVNMTAVQKINLQEHEILLQDGSILACSRRYLEELTQALSVLK